MENLHDPDLARLEIRVNEGKRIAPPSRRYINEQDPSLRLEFFDTFQGQQSVILSGPASDSDSDSDDPRFVIPGKKDYIVDHQDDDEKEEKELEKKKSRKQSLPMQKEIVVQKSGSWTGTLLLPLSVTWKFVSGKRKWEGTKLPVQTSGGDEEEMLICDGAQWRLHSSSTEVRMR